MAGAIRAYNLRRYHFAILNIVYLELLRVSKVLKNLSIFVRNRDPHSVIPSFLIV